MVVLGKSNIKLQIAGVTQVITDVFYILELRNNLFSIRQMQEKGVAILTQHGACSLLSQERAYCANNNVCK
jgi:hypothetical protein